MTRGVHESDFGVFFYCQSVAGGMAHQILALEVAVVDLEPEHMNLGVGRVQ